jgi:hypothetical protein
MKNRSLLLARKLAHEGFVVIPLLRDAKRPAIRWKRYQTIRPTDAELVAWFGDSNHEPAIVTGSLSGITVIDCDTHEAAESWPAPSPIRQTTKRGMHYVYRWNGERNAVAIGGVRGVDRRGEGGYVVGYPESVHWTRAAVDAAPVLPESHGKPVGLDDATEWPVEPVCDPVPYDEEEWSDDLPDDPEHDVYDFDESTLEAA